MPRIELNLSNLTQQRRNLASVKERIAQTDRELAGRQAELDTSLRRGADANATEALRAQLRELQKLRADLNQQRRELDLGIDRLADGLLAESDPTRLVTSLDGRLPIALLPIRLETRYFPPIQADAPIKADRLRIRVYPDDIHIVNHMPAVTESELTAGQAHWQARFRGDPAEAERISRDLAASRGRNRCAWLIRVLTPLNIDNLGGQDSEEPEFPDLQAISAAAKQTRALLLPDRWCAIGYAVGRREVFRVWGQRIPDELPLSPDWLNVGNPNQEAIFDGERAWMVDFTAAMDNGMALEVSQQAVNRFLAERNDAQGFNLATDRLERLLVVGLEWSKNPEQSAAELAELLAAQRDSDGLGFVPLGTPTNNTETVASGYSRSQESQAPAVSGDSPASPQPKDALELLSHAFGLPENALTADGIQNAHLAEQRTALHMINALWRGTFGHYLLEQWNPFLAEEKDRFLKTPTLYALRRYAVSYLRPGGALPLLRVGKQPYGLLPLVGKSFLSDGDNVEQGIGKLLTVLRPIWEIASQQVPLLKDGDVERAKDILQSNAWSQTALYRDAKPVYYSATSIPAPGSKRFLINRILDAFGIGDLFPPKQFAFNHTYLASWDFYPDPPYSANQLAGVPWVLADSQEKTKEAPATLSFNDLPVPTNYLRQLADNITNDTLLKTYQSGPALLQALLAYSVQLERHDAVQRFAGISGAADKISSVAMPHLSYVEPRKQDASRFAVNNPLELASVVIPQLTGNASLGQFVDFQLTRQIADSPQANAIESVDALFGAVAAISEPLRDVSAVRLSIDHLAKQAVGELNWTFKTTLDAFSYRLDAWYGARANRRLEQIRATKPTGVYLGGFAWVENLKADIRPDSEGYLLAPSLSQAATGAILRSGFMANHEQGAFNIDLNSKRTRQALDILQGLTRDQPLAALYGYRIERGLRDALLGKLIWPLRLAYPWRAAGAQSSDEPKEAIGARDVVDGVALLAAWDADGGNSVRARLGQIVAQRGLAAATAPSDAEWAKVAAIARASLDLADSVGDLLIAESTYQIVQGNFERAGAAMAVADKQSLPIEPQVANTPRSGASYTQRMALLCPPSGQTPWPEDRHSSVEPSLNAWLAFMLGAPDRYRFGATIFRGPNANPSSVVDQDPVYVGLAELGLSPLAAVLSASTIHGNPDAGVAETGFRGRLVEAFAQRVTDPTTVTGLDIHAKGADGWLGLAEFEALAETLRALLDKARPLTRKDLVVPDADWVDQGEYPGVDEAELRARADWLIDDFTAARNALAASIDAQALLTNLMAAQDYLAPAAWPQPVQRLSGTSPSDEDFAVALASVNASFDAKDRQLSEAPATETNPDGTSKPPNAAQRIQHAIGQIKLLLGKDFPVLPRFSLGGYVADFNASLSAQQALTLNDPWRIAGWLPKLSRVREGLDRFSGALSAHEVLVDVSGADDFKIIQYPHTDQPIWAALPEAWRDEQADDVGKAPEELRDYLAEQHGEHFKDINRVVPNLALALHTPGGLEAPGADTLLAGLVCDEWAEFIPDRFQTAAIGFHYDAPGARPPQTILLGLPPAPDQDNWEFDQVLDILHEAWDLAKLRAVRPKDLGSGIGTILPGNYLPHTYTGNLPSVGLKKMAEAALAHFATSIVPLGKS